MKQGVRQDLISIAPTDESTYRSWQIYPFVIGMQTGRDANGTDI
jgi:hypothetical protein